MSKKLPAFQLYPGDWRKDPGVQALDFEYRGVWFELLLLMHESDQRGKLLLNGNAMPDEAIARLLGLDKQKFSKIKSTLLEYGVASIDQDTGALVNRRMVRDEEIREKRRKAGKKGGNPNLLNQNGSKKGKKVNQNSNQSTTPSISSSSSPSGNNRESVNAQARGISVIETEDGEQIEIPKWDEWWMYAEAKSYAEEYARHLFDSLMYRGWINKDGQLVTDWHSYLNLMHKYQRPFLAKLNEEPKNQKNGTNQQRKKGDEHVDYYTRN